MQTTTRRALPLPQITDAGGSTFTVGTGSRQMTTDGVVRDTVRAISTLLDGYTDYLFDEQVAGRWEFQAPIITDKGMGQLFQNNTGATRIAGDVVMLDPANNSAVILPNTVGVSAAKVGIVAESINSGAVGRVAWGGFIRVNCAAGTVSRLQYLQTQNASALATGTTYASPGTFAIAVSNLDGSNTCLAVLHSASANLEGGGIIHGQITINIAADAVAILSDPGALTAAGVQNGQRTVQRANSYDTVNHTRDFVWRPRTTSNAGGGVLELITKLDGGADSTVFGIDNTGNFIYPVIVSVAADTVALQTTAPTLIAAGTQTGVRQVYRVNSYDTANHQRDFVFQPRTTTNAGVGGLDILTALDGSALTTLLTVLSSGQVGIGVNAPSAQLDTIGLIRTTGQTSTPTTGTGVEIYYSGTTGVVQAMTRPSTYIPMNMSGSIVSMVANGAVQVSFGPTSNSVTAPMAVVARIGTQVCLYDVGSGNAYGIGVVGGELVLHPSANAMVSFRDGSTTGVRGAYIVPVNGNAYFSGAIGVGTSAPSSAGTISASSWIAAGTTLAAAAGDLSSNRGASTGCVFLGTGTSYIYNDATAMRLYESSVQWIFGDTHGQVTMNGMVNGGPICNMYGVTAAGYNSGLNIYAGYDLSTDTILQLWKRDGSEGRGTVAGDGKLSLANSIATNTHTLGQSGTYYGVQTVNVANASGEGQAYAWVTFSSINNKSNIRSFVEAGKAALEHVKVVRVVRYDHHWAVRNRAKDEKGKWRWQTEHHDTPTLGFIAEEVHKELPELVSRDAAGNLGIDYGRMAAVLWEALKEVNTKVERLEAQLQGANNA